MRASCTWPRCWTWPRAGSLGFALCEHHDAELAYGALAMAVAVRGGAGARRDHAHRSGQRVHRAACSGRPAPGWASASRWAGPGRRWTTRSSSRGTPPWSSSCARVEHFATRAAARAGVAAWIEDYNHDRRHSALRHDVPGRLRAGAGRARTPRDRGRPLRGPGQKEAASPPLTFARLPRSRPGDAPREGTGPPLRPQGCCAPPAAAALRAGLDPGDLCGPSGRKHGQALACPARGAARPVSPCPAHKRTPGTEVNWRSIVRRGSEITRIR